MARPPSISREEHEESEGASSNRVDVVNTAPPSATNAMVVLRRELTRLSQQALAVERSLETQGRDRKEAIDRLDLSTRHTQLLERRLAASEAEAQSMRRLHETALEEVHKTREERDALTVIIQAAKAATDELARSRAEVERLKAAHEEATKHAMVLDAELVEVRKRQFKEALRSTDQDAEVGKLREHILRAEETAVQTRESAERSRQEAADERELSAKAREELAELREQLARERADSQSRIDALMRESEKTATKNAEEHQLLQRSIAEAEDFASAARNALARARGEVEAIQTDRDAADERASRSDAELASLRIDEAILREQLETALAASTAAIARAESAERAHAGLAQGMKQLVDEIVTGFGRNGIGPRASTSSMAAVMPPKPAETALSESDT